MTVKRHLFISVQFAIPHRRTDDACQLFAKTEDEMRCKDTIDERTFRDGIHPSVFLLMITNIKTKTNFDCQTELNPEN